MKLAEELIETAAKNADQATLAINRDRDAGGAISLSTLAIAQALIAVGCILQELGEKTREGKNQHGRDQEKIRDARFLLHQLREARNPDLAKKMQPARTESPQSDLLHKLQNQNKPCRDQDRS